MGVKTKRSTYVGALRSSTYERIYAPAKCHALGCPIRSMAQPDTGVASESAIWPGVQVIM